MWEYIFFFFFFFILHLHYLSVSDMLRQTLLLLRRIRMHRSPAAWVGVSNSSCVICMCKIQLKVQAIFSLRSEGLLKSWSLLHIVRYRELKKADLVACCKKIVKRYCTMEPAHPPALVHGWCYRTKDIVSSYVSCNLGILYTLPGPFWAISCVVKCDILP